MSVYRINELLPQILARAATMKAFQDMLNDMETDSERKSAIIEARMADELNDEDCHLLIEVYGLEG